MGGDQRTSARMISAIKLKVNSQTECKRLCGIVPVVEDWHTKVNFLTDIMYLITISACVEIVLQS